MSGKPDGSGEQPPQDSGTSSQEFHHSQVSARVPEKIGPGVFSTGVLILQTANEFVLDFVQGMVQPRRVAARVVLLPSFVPNLLNALRDNLSSYEKQYGPPPALRQPGANPPPGPPLSGGTALAMPGAPAATAAPAPTPPAKPAAPAPQVPIEEIYEQLKLPDDMLAGVYANGALIVHTQAEFCIDFIANFYPRAAVACRVYLATPQVQVLANTLAQSLQQYHNKLAQNRKPPEAPPTT